MLCLAAPADKSARRTSDFTKDLQGGTSKKYSQPKAVRRGPVRVSISPVSTRTIHGTFVGSHVNSDAYLPLSWSTKSRKASRIHRHGSKIGTERPGPWSTTAGADGNFPGLSPSEIEKLARPDQMRPQRGNDRGAPGR